MEPLYDVTNVELLLIPVHESAPTLVPVGTIKMFLKLSNLSALTFILHDPEHPLADVETGMLTCTMVTDEVAQQLAAWVGLGTLENMDALLKDPKNLHPSYRPPNTNKDAAVGKVDISTLSRQLKKPNLSYRPPVFNSGSLVNPCGPEIMEPDSSDINFEELRKTVPFSVDNKEVLELVQLSSNGNLVYMCMQRVKFGECLTVFMWIELGRRIHRDPICSDFVIMTPADTVFAITMYHRYIENISKFGETAQSTGVLLTDLYMDQVPKR